MNKWYEYFIEKIKQSYNQFVIINDLDHLGMVQSLCSELSINHAITVYKGELSLRQFIRQHESQQILILLQKEDVLLPYDIERNADRISLKLADIFPHFNSAALKSYMLEDYQSIYEMYKLMENSLGMLDEHQTKLQIAEWVRQGNVDARKIIYYEEADKAKDQIAVNENDKENICYKLIEKINQLINTSSISWTKVAQLYGNLQSYHPTELIDLKLYNDFELNIEKIFTNFMLQDYDQLFFASYKNGPVTINQTVNYLGTFDNRKIALLCMDGMGFPEWAGLKNYLTENKLTGFKEQAVFALIPTLTSVSRTSLFTGEVSVDKMISETAGFDKAVERQFKDGKKKTKFLFKNTDAKWNPEYLKYDALGIIFNIIDHVGHNMMLLTGSKKNMHMHLNELYKESQIALIIGKLLNEEYKVFITADHGSVWCSGNGLYANKYFVDERARRALVYPNKLLAGDFAKNSNVNVIQNQRILGEKVLVVPRGREMFNTKNKFEISHGGINIEEVIIPFVEVLP